MKPDIEKAEIAYGQFLEALGFENWKENPHMKDTPNRVSKAFIEDLFQGCYQKEPKVTAFDNVDKYDGMVFQGNIKLNSMCSHHILIKCVDNILIKYGRTIVFNLQNMWAKV
jgi:GTP cyclohydrolase I